MADRTYLAIDIGASGGRHLAGRFDGEKLRLDEVYRFENGPVEMVGRMYWDLPGLWRQVRQGLCVARAGEGGAAIASVGVDTWGVDFALLGRGDELLGNPYHYRDARTNGILERAFAIVPREEIFRHTGLQFMQFNTLYQLLAMKLGGSPLLDAAESLLFMPDLMHWLLTGVKCNEMTDASTSQFYDPVKCGWATELLDKFGLPAGILGKIAQPGAKLGPLRRGGGRDRPEGAGRLARLARHGQRRHGRPGAKQARPAARLVLYQPGHVGFDGHRVAPAVDQRAGLEA